MQLFDFLIWSFLVFLAIRLVLVMVNTNLEQQLEERETLLKKLNEVIHVVKEERHGDILYWFDKDNEQFLAQGRNIEEIRAHLKQRFHKHVFLINESEMLAGENYEVLPIADLRK